MKQYVNTGVTYNMNEAFVLFKYSALSYVINNTWVYLACGFMSKWLL